MSKAPELYRVRKIFDRKTNKVVQPGSSEASRMCGQAAIAFVPTKKYIEMQKIAKTDKKTFNKWAAEADWSEIWEKQLKFDPIIGQPVYFSSVKMDAGYYRTSMIEKVEQGPKEGDFTVTTVGSILIVSLDD